MAQYEITMKSSNGINFDGVFIDKQELDDKEEKLKEAHDSLEEKKKDLEREKKEHSDCKAQLNTAQRDLATTQESLQKTETALQQERNKYEIEKEAHIDCKAQLKAVQSDVATARKSLQDKENAWQQEKSERKKEKEEDEMAKNKLKDRVKTLEDKVKNIESKLEKEEKAHTQTQQDSITKIESLLNEKDEITKEFEDLQGAVKTELYTLYKQICPEKDNYGIKGENLYTFLITSGQMETLENIVESIKISAANNTEKLEKEKELFNKLLDSMQNCYNLERVKANVGDNYDEHYFKIDGDSTGKISEVVLDGFSRNGNVRKKPLVKVKR